MSSIIEVTREGFGSRGKKSIGGVFFGFALIPLSIFLIFWNEGRAVQRYQDLKEGSGAVVSVSSEVVDADHEGKLVHFSGEATTKEPLNDSLFGISELAIRLGREVEMYQWVEDVQTETRNKTGGGTETTKTYSYRTEWRPDVVNASQFKKSGYENPTSLPYPSRSSFAKDVSVGAFRIPEFFVRRIGSPQSFAPETLEAAAPEIREKGILAGDAVYFGGNPASPEVGDVRVKFSIVRPGPISVVAQQEGDTLVRYQTKNETTLELLEDGIVPAEEMFSRAVSRNKMMTWAIRGGLFLMLGFGFALMLKPLVVLASVLPFLGRIAETGTAFVSFLLGGIVWAVCVAIAWVFHRPIIGIIGLVLAISLVFWIVVRVRASGSASSGRSDAPPPLDSPPPLG